MNKREFDQINANMPAIGSAPVFIYCLLDPDTCEARYIGKSIRPIERLSNHMQDGGNCHRTHWLQKLKAEGKKPDMVLLERIDGDWPWQESERFWIAYGRAMGWPLTNNTDGGDGVPGLPEETRARMRAAWVGRKHKPESIEKIRRASASRRHSAETRALMSTAHSGRKITWSDKVSASLRRISDEQVIDIARRLSAGEGTCAIAKEFGVHRTTISKIKMGTYYGK